MQCHSKRRWHQVPCQSAHLAYTAGESTLLMQGNASDDTLSSYVKQQAFIFIQMMSSRETAVMLGMQGHRTLTSEFNGTLGKKLEAQCISNWLKEFFFPSCPSFKWDYMKLFGIPLYKDLKKRLFLSATQVQKLRFGYCAIRLIRNKGNLANLALTARVG